MHPLPANSQSAQIPVRLKASASEALRCFQIDEARLPIDDLVGTVDPAIARFPLCQGSCPLLYFSLIFRRAG
jgi:hypothetical protein